MNHTLTVVQVRDGLSEQRVLDVVLRDQAGQLYMVEVMFFATKPDRPYVGSPFRAARNRDGTVVQTGQRLKTGSNIYWAVKDAAIAAVLTRSST